MIGATLGGAEAKYKLAKRYEYGDGVEQNIEKAMKWYRKAAKQGHAEAHFYLASNGEGTEWYRMAAENGHAGAQCYIGECFYGGEGVEQDYAEAAKWFQKAADQGNKAAKNQLDHLNSMMRRY